MLAIGAGSLDVAMVLAGEPLFVGMPEIWGIKLTGKLPNWVSAKDVILEMLRRHSVAGGVGRIVEYYGPGVATLTAIDRHVIANMGAELGATTTVFPSDSQTWNFLEKEGRGDHWIELPKKPIVLTKSLLAPLPLAAARKVRLVKGPNIRSLPPIAPLADALEVPVLLKLGDDISTDAISPAGARALPFRSNVQKIAEFSFDTIDDTYAERALAVREASGHALVAGVNYGQGSSREHATLAPGYLGLRVLIAKTFARIHGQNLPNSGILPLTFVDPADYDKIEQGDVVVIRDIRGTVSAGASIEVEVKGKGRLPARHHMTARQVEILLCGGLINWVKHRTSISKPRGRKAG